MTSAEVRVKEKWKELIAVVLGVLICLGVMALVARLENQLWWI